MPYQVLHKQAPAWFSIEPCPGSRIVSRQPRLHFTTHTRTALPETDWATANH